MADANDTPVGDEPTAPNSTNPLIHDKTGDTLSACKNVLCFIQDAIPSNLEQMTLTVYGKEGLYNILQCIKGALDYEFRR